MAEFSRVSTLFYYAFQFPPTIFWNCNGWFYHFRMLDATAAVPSPRPHDWNRYQTLDEVNAFLNKQAQIHWKVVTPLLAGYSYEGRPIRGVKISYGLVIIYKSS